MSVSIELVAGPNTRLRRRRLCGYCRSVMRRKAVRCTYCGHRSFARLHLAFFVILFAALLVLTFNLINWDTTTNWESLTNWIGISSWL